MPGRSPARPLRRAALLVMALGIVAACSREDPPLPGERFAVRPPDPAAEAPATAPPLALPPAEVNADWTHRNGAAGGRPIHPALAAQPVLRWSADIGQGAGRRTRILTAPVTGGGLVYAMDAAGQLTAISTADGRPAWRLSVVPEGQRPDAALGGGLAYEGGRLFATTGFGEALAIDPASGGVIWRRALEGPVRGAPTVLEGRVFVVTRSDVAVALDAGTGQVLWRVQGAGGGAGILGGSSPAADGPLVVLPFASGEVLGVVARSGLQAWGQAITGGRRELVRNRINDVSGDPVIVGNTVYASNQSGRTISLDRLTGERNWTIAEGSYGPAWPVGGSIFLISDLAELVRADAATGQILWTQQLPLWRDERRRREAYAHHGPVLAGGRLWVAGGDGLLRAFQPATGAPLGTIALGAPAAAPPAVARGVMYVVTTDGRISALQ